MRKAFVGIGLAMMMPAAALAQGDCSTYPYRTGIDHEALLQDKWISTAIVAVEFDDVSAREDARNEAELVAKGNITATIDDRVKREAIANRAAEQSVTVQNGANGPSKDAVRKQVSENILRLSGKSESLLRGAVVIGDCYTPGKEYRVTVGIKPELIDAVGRHQQRTNDSRRQDSGGVLTINPQAAPQGGGLNRSEGFDNSAGIKRF